MLGCSLCPVTADEKVGRQKHAADGETAHRKREAYPSKREGKQGERPARECERVRMRVCVVSGSKRRIRQLVLVSEFRSASIAK